MKITRILAFAALLLPAFLQAQAEYYGYFSPADTIQGNSQHLEYNGKHAFEILSYSLSAEHTGDLLDNNRVGQIQLDRLYLLIETDGSLFTGFIKALTTGEQFTEFFIEGRLPVTNDDSNTFIKLSFKNAVISSVELEGTQGDRGVFRVVVDYVAIKVEGYKADLTTGEYKLENEMKFNRETANLEY